MVFSIYMKLLQEVVKAFRLVYVLCLALRSDPKVAIETLSRCGLNED